MKPFFDQNFRLGILGGGQLGRMLIQAGINFNIPFTILDPDPQAPCSSLAPFRCGKLTDYDTVLEFGMGCDVITIEIEHVNTLALKELAKRGKKVFPQPEVIELIQDKRLQKVFFRDHGIPSPPFVLTESLKDIQAHHDFLPAVNKLGREGYDGRGVQIIRHIDEIHKGFDAPGLLEKFVDVDKEIAIIVARNAHGTVTYPAVEMAFNPQHNLVEYLFSPADLSPMILSKAHDLAIKTITSLDMTGILAVEMFIDKSGNVLVNEVAPRPHNSGHHTIEANITSQYEQHLRAILGLPLGKTDRVLPAAMVNILGEPGHTGPAQYQGFEEVAKIPGAHIHLYGKFITKPFRKMGHVTLVGQDVDQLRKNANFVKNTLKAISK